MLYNIDKDSFNYLLPVKHSGGSNDYVCHYRVQISEFWTGVMQGYARNLQEPKHQCAGDDIKLFMWWTSTFWNYIFTTIVSVCHHPENKSCLTYSTWYLQLICTHTHKKNMAHQYHLNFLHRNIVNLLTGDQFSNSSQNTWHRPPPRWKLIGVITLQTNQPSCSNRQFSNWLKHGHSGLDLSLSVRQWSMYKKDQCDLIHSSVYTNLF